VLEELQRIRPALEVGRRDQRAVLAEHPEAAGARRGVAGQGPGRWRHGRSSRAETPDTWSCTLAMSRSPHPSARALSKASLAAANTEGDSPVLVACSSICSRIGCSVRTGPGAGDQVRSAI